MLPIDFQTICYSNCRGIRIITKTVWNHIRPFYLWRNLPIYLMDTAWRSLCRYSQKYIWIYLDLVCNHGPFSRWIQPRKERQYRWISLQKSGIWYEKVRHIDLSINSSPMDILNHYKQIMIENNAIKSVFEKFPELFSHQSQHLIVVAHI